MYSVKNYTVIILGRWSRSESLVISHIDSIYPWHGVMKMAPDLYGLHPLKLRTWVKSWEKHQINQNWEIFYKTPDWYPSKISRSWEAREDWGTAPDYRCLKRDDDYLTHVSGTGPWNKEGHRGKTGGLQMKSVDELITILTFTFQQHIMVMWDAMLELGAAGWRA